MAVVSTAGLGTAALPEGGRVDFARLRRDRRARVLAVMEEHGLDGMVLGRPANVSYVSGARQLWTAGARPFGPAAVVQAGTGRVHLLSTWDDGVPAEVDRSDLYGLSWNPAVILGNLRGIEWLAGATRLATDAWGPGIASLMGRVAPGAEVVDAAPVMGSARSVKTDDEVTCLRTAAAAAEAGLAALVGALRPGVTERRLLAVHAGTLARLGLPVPPVEAPACITTPRLGAAGAAGAADGARGSAAEGGARDGGVRDGGVRGGGARLRRVVSDAEVRGGDLVVLSGGAVFAGYEATLSRTWLVPGGSGATSGQLEVAARARELRDARVAVCRPGLAAGRLGPSESADGEPVAWGVGLGMEAPLLGAGLGAGVQLRAGMTLAVQAWAADEGVGGALEADVVLVGEAGPEMLTRFRSCPALGVA